MHRPGPHRGITGGLGLLHGCGRGLAGRREVVDEELAGETGGEVGPVGVVVGRHPPDGLSQESDQVGVGPL